VIKACLNGNRAPGAHPALPLTPAQLAADAAAAVAAGAQAIHIHPRDADGRETLAVDETVRAVHAAAPGVPVGVSTGAWMEPDVEARVAAVRAWREPDMASVNLSEEGHAEVMVALVDVGVGIEAGLLRVEDVEALQASGFADRLVRVLVEPREDAAAAALATAEAIHAALDAAGIPGPRVQHGYGPPTWEVIRRAKALGHGWRIGLEDTLVLPNGTPARSNAHLVTVAVEL
jgi:uncharacterized protein (DUF849 family)